MPTFTIDSGNILRVHAGKRSPPVVTGSSQFTSEEELSALATGWPAKRLIEIWKKLPNVGRVNKFTDRKTAVRRIWKAVRELEPAAGGSRATSPHAQSKAARVIALLKYPSGATLEALMAATGWQPHSVRGFISGQLSKRMNLPVESFSQDGKRVYRICSSGMGRKATGKKR